MTSSTSDLYNQRSFFCVAAMLILALVALLPTENVLSTNRDLFMWLNQPEYFLLSESWVSLISYLGEVHMALFICLCLLIQRADSGLRLLCTILLVAVLTHGLKLYYDAPRPSAVLSLAEVHIIGERLQQHSLPSGHTATAFAVAGFIWLHYRHYQWPLVVLILASIVGWSRIAVGAHWPLDVALGALIGYMSPLVVSRFVNLSDKKRLNHGIFACLFVSVCAVSSTYALLAYTQPLIMITSIIVALGSVLFAAYHCYIAFGKSVLSDSKMT